MPFMNRTFLCLIFYLFAFRGQSQDTLVMPVQEKVAFGFCIGGSNFIPGLRQADIYHAATGYQDSISGITARGTLGFMLSFMIEFQLQKEWYLRLSPGFLFNDYVVYYNRMNGRTDFMSSQNSFFELPAHLAYKFKTKKIKPVIVAGSSYKVEYTRPRNQFAHARYWSLDVGALVEKKIGRITISPGIRYAYALTDVSISRRIENPRLIDRMRLNTIYFTLCFKT